MYIPTPAAPKTAPSNFVQSEPSPSGMGVSNTSSQLPTTAPIAASNGMTPAHEIQLGTPTSAGKDASRTVHIFWKHLISLT